MWQASTPVQIVFEALHEFVCSSQKQTVCVCVLQRPLSATSSSVWLPYTSIDQLLQILNETQTNSTVSLQPLGRTLTSCLFFVIVPSSRFDCGKCSSMLQVKLLKSQLVCLQMYNKVRDKLDEYHKLVEQTTKRRLTTR